MPVILRRLTLTAALALCPLLAYAQPDRTPTGSAAQAAGDQKAATPENEATNPTLWNADRMMEDAVLTISRRYNLNGDQEKYTRVLLTKKTKEFLAKYEPELRQLLKESFDLRFGRMPATPENYKSWAERARPVYEAAKLAILEGNREWGGSLNEDQKRIHKQDLDQMQMSFLQIDGLLEKWKAGGFSSADLAPQQAPRITTEGHQKGMVSPNPVVDKRDVEEAWELYTKRVIAVYHFTPDQQIAALAILKDSRGRAKNYRDSRKGEVDAIETKLRAAMEARNTGEAAKLRAQQAELERPVGEIFIALKDRLDQIPTKAQREAITEDQRKNLEMFGAEIGPKPVVPQTGPAQPLAKPEPEKKAQPPASTKPSHDEPASRPVAAPGH